VSVYVRVCVRACVCVRVCVRVCGRVRVRAPGGRSGGSHGGRELDGRDAVALEQNPPDKGACVLLGVQLLGVVEHEVHVLVEANQPALNAQVQVLVEHDLHS